MGPNLGKIKTRIAAPIAPPDCTAASNDREWPASLAIPFLPQMLDQKASRAVLDRRTVAGFLRRAIAAAEALPRAGLHRRLAAPAGIPLDLWFDDEGEADLAAARLACGAPEAEQVKPARLYTLGSASIGLDLLPSWRDEACPPAEFHAVVGEAELRAAFPFHPQLWLAFAEGAGVGVQLARSPTDLPVWFAGAPLRHHLHWLLRARGLRVAHAASLGQNGRGILLLGHGGSGKSGTTLAGLAVGLQTVGDDYVALGGAEPALARILFRTVKQDRTGLARIAGLEDRLAQLPLNWMNKVVFDPADFFPGCFTESLRIEAIVLPHIAHAAVPRFTSATAGDAMRTLMRSNLFQYLGEADDGLDYYAALLRSLPIHRLELSDNAADNGAALAAFIAALG
jgi:hypothetical protein